MICANPTIRVGLAARSVAVCAEVQQLLDAVQAGRDDEAAVRARAVFRLVPWAFEHLRPHAECSWPRVCPCSLALPEPNVLPSVDERTSTLVKSVG